MPQSEAAATRQVLRRLRAKTQGTYPTLESVDWRLHVQVVHAAAPFILLCRKHPHAPAALATHADCTRTHLGALRVHTLSTTATGNGPRGPVQTGSHASQATPSNTSLPKPLCSNTQHVAHAHILSIRPGQKPCAWMLKRVRACEQTGATGIAKMADPRSIISLGLRNPDASSKVSI